MTTIAQDMLVQYITALNTNPLRTKMLTSGTLAALAEILAGKFAGVAPATKKLPPSHMSEKKLVQEQPVQYASALVQSLGINKKVIMMFLYGFGVSAPLGHVMTGQLQKAFAGKTTPRDRVKQIVVSNLTVSVISNLVYLVCASYINGVRGIDRIMMAVRANIMFLMKVSWVTSPAAIAVAQRFLAPQLWEPWFSFVRFLLATTFNTITKKKQMALQRKQRDSTTDAELRKGAAQGK